MVVHPHTCLRVILMFLKVIGILHDLSAVSKHCCRLQEGEDVASVVSRCLEQCPALSRVFTTITDRLNYWPCCLSFLFLLTQPDPQPGDITPEVAGSPVLESFGQMPALCICSQPRATYFLGVWNGGARQGVSHQLTALPF